MVLYRKQVLIQFVWKIIISLWDADVSMLVWNLDFIVNQVILKPDIYSSWGENKQKAD